MQNSDEYWENLSTRIEKPSDTKNKRPDTSDLEIDFLKEYVNDQDEILDLGSGTGLIINKLIPFVKHITAVEKFEGFTRHITNSPSILVINSDLIGFKIRKEFDAVLCTGVAQCFSKDVMFDMYSNIFKMLKKKGKLYLRIHCGLKENVLVNGFSEELQTDYFAEYRQKDAEIKLLKEIGFKSVEVHDIFPDSLNVWDNTRHFYFICAKP